MNDESKSTGMGAMLGGAAGGMAGGAAAGAAAGGITGPVGAVIGAAAGAVMGAIAGRNLSEADHPLEDAFWRENYASRPYASGASYDDFGPAYSHGAQAYAQYQGQGRSFEDVEADLARDWTRARGASTLDWERARPASRDAWHRLSERTEQALLDDSQRHGL